jgi:hypothetical protein
LLGQVQAVACLRGGGRHAKTLGEAVDHTDGLALPMRLSRFARHCERSAAVYDFVSNLGRWTAAAYGLAVTGKR